MKRYYFTLLIAAVAVVLVALNGCIKEPALGTSTPKLPTQPYNYEATQNNNLKFSLGDNTPTNNQVTNAGATLGRVLFYDKRLSVNNSIACASCHKQDLAFADNVAFSDGFAGKKTARNSMAIINTFCKSSFFWDGRANTMEQQTLMPVKNHVEMGLENFDVLQTKLAQTSFYPELFNAAFGNTEVTSEKISLALAQFMRSIVSNKSKFDVAGWSGLSESEMRGANIFFSNGHCSTCHRTDNFGGAPITTPYGGQTDAPANSSNIGLDMEYADAGIGALNNKPGQNGLFIIPSLRNVELTAPYMHDGRFQTLEEVIEHYNNGIQPNVNLDHVLVQGGDSSSVAVPVVPVKLNLSAADKVDLIAFLKTLTDHSITTDPKYSDPFK
ncbi:MAG: cytochrome c peroxidase [Chitinophagales bacterium]